MNVPIIKPRSSQSQTPCNTLINTAFIFLNRGRNVGKTTPFTQSYVLRNASLRLLTRLKTLNCITLFTNETIEYSYLEVQFAWQIVMADQKLCSSSVFRRVYKLRKATVSFVMSVCPSDCMSVCLHRTIRFPRMNFQRILLFRIFLKTSMFYPTVTRIVHKLINRRHTSRKFTITPMVIRGAESIFLFIRVIRICANTVWSLL